MPIDPLHMEELLAAFDPFTGRPRQPTRLGMGELDALIKHAEQTRSGPALAGLRLRAVRSTSDLVPEVFRNRPALRTILPEGGARKTDAPSMRPVSLRWLRQAYEAAQAVVSIEHRGSPQGSGFLVEGALLAPVLQGRTLVVTAAHVCGGEGAPDPRDVELVFRGEDDAELARRPGPRLCWRASAMLDTVVLDLPGALPGRARALSRLAHSLPPGTLTSLVSYPDGQRLEVDMVQEARPRPPFFRHRARSEPGSSGGPVFDLEWRLAGIHLARQAGGDDREGVLMNVVVTEARQAEREGRLARD